MRGVSVCAVLLLAFSLSLALVPSGMQSPQARTTPLDLVSQISTTKQSRTTDAVRSSPTMFIENAGQFDEGARFQVRGGMGAGMWLVEDGIWVTHLESEVSGMMAPDASRSQALDRKVQSHKGVNLKLSFRGANPDPEIVPFNRLDTKVSYFIGGDPAGWHPDVPVWGGVRYVDIYPGVDLELASDGGGYAHRLLVQPGADLSVVRLRVDGADGITCGDQINCRLHTSVGDWIMPPWQVVSPNGDRVDLQAARLELGGSGIEAPLPSFPAVSSPLAIPPPNNAEDLLYSTFLGGSQRETGMEIAVDDSGSAYVTGFTYSPDFPTTTGAFDTSIGGSDDLFVVKLDPSGSNLVYATFIGGENEDQGRGIAVSREDGSVYLTGFTRSPDFPATAGAFQDAYNPGTDCYEPPCADGVMVKLNPEGTTLIYSSFLGGSGEDKGMSIALDLYDRPYVAGDTVSTDFPVTAGSFATVPAGNDTFVTSFSGDGRTLRYSTYLGGDLVEGIAVDSLGSAYVTGGVGGGLPTTPGAFDTTYNGFADAFVAKLTPSGSELVYSTFLGGRTSDYGNDIAVDSSGCAYVTGFTGSNDFPTTLGAFDTVCTVTENHNVIVVKLNSLGTDLIYSTCVGTYGANEGHGIAIDSWGSAYVTGLTYDDEFPVTDDAIYKTRNPFLDAFLLKVSPSGASLSYSTYFGGDGGDTGLGVAVDLLGDAYITGYSQATVEFPTTPGAWDPTFNGFTDAFAAKIAIGEGMAPTFSVSGHVRDQDGAPVPGVVVTAGPAVSGTTDEDGFYAFSGLLPGTYTLVPQRNGYIFSPLAQTVDVRSDVVDIDFVAAPNFSIFHIEATQGIQCYDSEDPNCPDNSVPLFSGKPTVFRAYLSSNSGIVQNLRGTLYVDDGLTCLAVDNDNVLAEAVEHAEFDRESDYHALRFTLPGSISSGTVRYHAEAYLGPDGPRVRYPAMGEAEISFVDTGNLRIGYMTFEYEGDTPDPDRVARGYEYTESLYPVAQVDYFPVTFFLPPDLWQSLHGPRLGVIAYLQKVYAWYETMGWPEPNGKPEVLFGWVPYTTWWREADGVNSDNIAFATDTPTNDWYQMAMAHEIGHHFGLHDLFLETSSPTSPSDQCDKAEQDWPFDDDSDEIYDYAIHDVGFDFGVYAQNALVSPTTDDFMIGVHCGAEVYGEKWLSGYTFNKLFEARSNQEQVSSMELAVAEEVGVEEAILLISGRVYTDTTAELDAAFQLTATQVYSQTSGADYCLELQDELGTSLSSNCFDLSFVDPEWGTPLPLATFVRALPYDSAAARLVLRHQDDELAERLVSSNSPMVTIQAPNGGEAISGTVDVSWSAYDADGDPLEYALSYSPDGSQSWYHLGIGITQTHLLVDTGVLPGGEDAIFQVAASDGINTAYDTSDDFFAVLPHSPDVYIVNPEDGLVLPYGQPLVLRGRGYDMEDGILNDEALNWTSNLEGVLGSGRTLLVTDLRHGDHVITLTAQDSDSNTTLATVNLSVGWRVYLPVVLR